jgi:hypothetical protein
VVGILDELSVLDKDEFIIGFVEKVVVPRIVLEAVEDPMDREPLVKLSHILKAEVELFACILLT